MARGQNNLEIMYFNGRGIAQDKTKAAKWYRKAAEQGNAIAQFNLGYLYAVGQGVTQDKAEAAKWYRKAVEQVHAEAKNG